MVKSPSQADAKKGVIYLFVLSVAGLLLATYLAVLGIIEVWGGHWLGGIGTLILAVILALAGVRVSKMWKEAGEAVSESRPSPHTIRE